MVPYKVSVTPIIGKALSSNRTYHQGLLSPIDSCSLSSMCMMHTPSSEPLCPHVCQILRNIWLLVFLVVCMCHFRRTGCVCQQTTHRLTHCHHWKHRLTFFPPSPTPYPDSQPFLPLSPFTLLPSPPKLIPTAALYIH